MTTGESSCRRVIACTYEALVIVCAHALCLIIVIIIIHINIV